MDKKQDLLTMKEVEDLTGLTEHTIRTWCKRFNIQLETTEGGHRRFSKSNIEMLLAIKEKKEDQNWSMKQIGNWLNGEVSTSLLQSAEVKTNLEKKVENLEESVQMLVDLNKKLVEKLDEQNNNFNKQLELHINTINKKLEDETEKRDRQLMLEIRKSQEEVALAKAIEKKTSFFSKIFGLKK